MKNNSFFPLHNDFTTKCIQWELRHILFIYILDSVDFMPDVFYIIHLLHTTFITTFTNNTSCNKATRTIFFLILGILMRNYHFALQKFGLPQPILSKPLPRILFVIKINLSHMSLLKKKMKIRANLQTETNKNIQKIK